MELIPVHEMTEKDWESLSDEEKFRYPRHEDGASPSHNNYHFCCLVLYVQEGNSISNLVWNSLTRGQQDYLSSVSLIWLE